MSFLLIHTPILSDQSKGKNFCSLHPVFTLNYTKFIPSEGNSNNILHPIGSAVWLMQQLNYRLTLDQPGQTALVRKFASSKNPSIYRYIKSFVEASDLSATLAYNSTTATSDLDKANAFINYFYSVFYQNSSHICLSDLPFLTKSFCFVTFSKEDTYKTLTSLDPTNAMGDDSIPPIVIKHCAVALLEPVHHIFTQCVSQSFLPNEWKSHNIIPIPNQRTKHKSKAIVPSLCPVVSQKCLRG